MPQRFNNFYKCNLSAKELANLYLEQHLNCKQIADKMGVVKSTVLAWLKAFDIPVRSVGEANSGKYHWRWKGGGTKIICQICGKGKMIPSHELKRGKGKTCSKKCMGILERGENHYLWKPKVKKTCETCSEEFEVFESQSHQRTCGKRECQIKGDVSKLWKGGKMAYQRRRYAQTLKYDLKYRTKVKISNAIRQSLIDGKNGNHWEDLVGYSLGNLINRLSKTMPNSYDWQDFLNGRLDIDHIIPVSAFNFTTTEHIDFKRCWALSNLRLLPAKENKLKGAKLDEPFQPSLRI